jgi:hypothetical protein
MTNLADILINLLLAIVSIVIALWYENLGSPRLEILPDITNDELKPNNRRTRFIHLGVVNKPRRVPFVTRQTAYSCHGTITFLTPSLQSIGNPMPIKWDGTAEPLNPEIVNNQIVNLLDQRLLRFSRYIDIPPDEKETLAVAVRIHGDTLAFGWTGESYAHDWRHPDFKFPPGNYVARVTITTGDSKTQKDFAFENPDRFEAFDLSLSKGAG